MGTSEVAKRNSILEERLRIILEISKSGEEERRSRPILGGLSPRNEDEMYQIMTMVQNTLCVEDQEKFSIALKNISKKSAQKAIKSASALLSSDFDFENDPALKKSGFLDLRIPDSPPGLVTAESLKEDFKENKVAKDY